MMVADLDVGNFYITVVNFISRRAKLIPVSVKMRSR